MTVIHGCLSINSSNEDDGDSDDEGDAFQQK
jgi:hypothetical protein